MPAMSTHALIIVFFIAYPFSCLALSEFCSLVSWPTIYSTGSGSKRTSIQKLLGVGYQVNVGQFIYVLDHDGVSSPPFINLAAKLHVFSDEWHQALALILVWHRRGYRR